MVVDERPAGIVFPTRVGMVRGDAAMRSMSRGFPHPRGDGPNSFLDWPRSNEFSPPAWGWSAQQAVINAARLVFPTRVGMVRHIVHVVNLRRSFPHPRGDGPNLAHHTKHTLPFSPPAWGWSDYPNYHPRGVRVFPTRVGMVRSSLSSNETSPCFPHPRGDGPCFVIRRRIFRRFSPPAWGWSAEFPLELQRRIVFPTRVGMVRALTGARVELFCFPHPRGDGPMRHLAPRYAVLFSPPAWGWRIVPRVLLPGEVREKLFRPAGGRLLASLRGQGIRRSLPWVGVSLLTASLPGAVWTATPPPL